MRMTPVAFALALAFSASLSPLVQAAPKKGDALPAFSLAATSGTRVTQKMLQDTDLGILYFFSTEKCPTCLSGIEQLKQIAASHSDDSLRIVMLGKQSLAKLKQAIPVSSPNVQVVSADDKTLASFNAQHVLPTTYITGPGGEISAMLQGGGASTEKLLVSLADKQLQRQKPESAAKLFDSASKSGKDSLAMAGKGYSLLKAGKVDAAEAVFTSLAKSRNKESALRGQEGLAEIKLARGDNQGAVKAADSILASAPKRVAANLIKSRALNQMGDNAQAEITLAAATRDDAGADFGFQRAEANLAQGNLLSKKSPKIALASFKMAAKENPHSVEAISNLGALENALGDPKTAAESLRKALALAPGDKLLHSLMRQAQESLAQKQDLEYQRYIDETVKDLANRFKADQTKPKTAGDDWTTPPTVISILGFKDESAPSLSGRVGLEGVLQHELQQALMARGITVVDRALMDKLLAELNLGSSQLADPDTQLKLGRIMAARLMATGTVRSGAQGNASMRMIDTETTGIALSTSEKLAANVDPAAMAAQMADNIAKAIHDKYPVKGRVAQAEGDSIALNLGKKHGVKVGQVFNVLGMNPQPIELNGKVLGYKDSPMGQLAITEVQDGLSFAKPVGAALTLAKNQRVIQKD